VIGRICKVVVTLGLVASSACGDEKTDTAAEGGAGTGSAPADSMTPERFERAVAAAVCEAADLCNLGSFVAQVRADGRCEEAMLRYVSGSHGGMARLRAAIEFGEASFDADAARACLESFERKCPQSFNLLVNGEPPLAWCPEAFVGACRSGEKVPWQAPLAPEASCGITGRGPACPPGQGCSSDTLACRPCDGSSADGLRCLPEPDEALAALYLTDRPEGASCEYTGAYAPCNAGLVCNIEDDGLVCVELRPAGADCSGGFECAGGCDIDQKCTSEC
jgi:hypothetical protein